MEKMKILELTPIFIFQKFNFLYFCLSKVFSLKSFPQNCGKVCGMWLFLWEKCCAKPFLSVGNFFLFLKIPFIIRLISTF